MVSGLNGITSAIVSRAMSNMKKLLSNTFTACLREGHFPEVWKESKLVLLQKSGKPEELPSLYRPICVLNETGKLFERITGQRIKHHMREVGPDLSPDQYGFRQNGSTVDVILEYKTRIYNITSQGEIEVPVSIDISNAFNTIS